MRIPIRIAGAFVALAALAPHPAAAADPLRLVAATTDVGAIARAVAGPDAEIEVVARPDRDPHALEIRPSTMRKVARADVYLEVGLSLDLWSDAVVRGSRNRDLVVLDCAAAIEPLEVPDGPVDASMGDVHPEGNPHWWLDPVRTVAVARYLAAELGRVAPERAADFAAHAEAFAATVEARMPAWRARLEGRRIVEYHATWTYLAERFGMEIVGQVEPLPGIPPTAHHLADLAALIRARGVPVVVRDVYHATSGPEFLARETGARVVTLAASCPEPTPEAWIAHLDAVAEALGGP